MVFFLPVHFRRVVKIVMASHTFNICLKVKSNVTKKSYFKRLTHVKGKVKLRLASYKIQLKIDQVQRALTHYKKGLWEAFCCS